MTGTAATDPAPETDSGDDSSTGPSVATPRPSEAGPAGWYVPRPIPLAKAVSPSDPSDTPQLADEPAAGQPAAVFSQQLCEVQLLLDFLSGSPARRLPDASAAVAAGLPRDWIEQICRISWPPAGTLAAQADEEALLVKVKDYLNALAAPANGASVAFTLLVAQEDDAIDAAEPIDPAVEAQSGRAFSRNSLARIAFPGLVGKSRGFRTGMLSIGIGLTIWLVLTCGLSWYAALGNARLAQLSTATAALDAARAKLTVSAPAVTDNGTASSSAPDPVVPAGAIVAGPVTFSCERPTSGPSSAIRAASCSDLAVAQANLESARTNVRAWWRFGSGAGTATALVDDATSALGVLGTGVLPVFYGILGAAAAVLRLLSGRMRLSLLMPRDLTLSLQQLALGAVVGACIGLFVNPGTDGAGSGVLGTVSLSSSALSFVAGFGVEAVFATLEGLIARLFNTAPSAAPLPAESKS